MPGRSGAQFQVERNGHESRDMRPFSLFTQRQLCAFECRVLRIAQVKRLTFMTQTDKTIITKAARYYSLCGLVVRVPAYRSRGPGFDSRSYQIFWEVEGLELGPLSLVSTIEELLGRNSSGFGLENREYGRGDPLRWPATPSIPKSWH
jgi:hypothetical protein